MTSLQFWTLVLEYLKVAFGYSVTVPALILILCWLFREEIRRILGRLHKASYGRASIELARYTEYVEKTAETVTKTLAPATDRGTVEALTFFGLAARLLPLIPKRDRRRFIEQQTKALPHDFHSFRTALLALAEEAPESFGGGAEHYRAALAELAGFKPIPTPKV